MALMDPCDSIIWQPPHQAPRTRRPSIPDPAFGPWDISQLRATTTVDAPLLLVPNVWRADGDQAPVRVTVEIDGPVGGNGGRISRG